MFGIDISAGEVLGIKINETAACDVDKILGKSPGNKWRLMNENKSSTYGYYPNKIGYSTYWFTIEKDQNNIVCDR